MTKNTSMIALAIVKNDQDEVLIVKRKKPEKGLGGSELTWVFPGGVVEGTDTPEETCVQEALEETGHYVETLNLINKRKHPQYPVHLHYFECQLTTDATTQLIDDHEIEQIAWVKIHKLMDHFNSDLDKKVAKFLGLKK
jgi:8-oxo-dGTP diphosphatase